ncbi:DUF2599 domain-containing protein [soil metagenome]
MRRLIAAVFIAASGAALTAPVAQAEQDPPPPYVQRAEWAKWGDLSSLRVYPTAAGRALAGELGHRSAGEEAWTEVLALSPDADIPGMREQFLCHWGFAELAFPGKSSWNLEPWRPEVSEADMFGAGCNPGGTEEPF